MANCENVEGVKNMNPILGKNDPHEIWDYNLMTWDMFLKIRSWAQGVADKNQAPVYLVGSVLKKDLPRDIDISVIFPVADYEVLFGTIPTATNDSAFTQKVMPIMHKAQSCQARIDAYWELAYIFDHKIGIDLKFCPDVWWTEKDKLLLANPRGTEHAKSDCPKG
jgi:hypothetical protein